ncbi:unnamed protein product [Urochloa decumbens]|uniref:SHSP domain-containing protein n=1 Tax=Urochloa decumbens TaxID=240449 RepID=A0ABC8VJ92_9POAL
MDRRRRATREFEELDPDVEWKLAGEDEDVDVVEISLPGFCKDQVRVQVDNHGVLRASGERPASGGRWARFNKDLLLPDSCDADAVRAMFEDEKLIITMPIVDDVSGDTREGNPPPESPKDEPPSPEVQEREIPVSSPSPARDGTDKETSGEEATGKADQDITASMKNTAAAVAVLVGIIWWWVWRNLSSS